MKHKNELEQRNWVAKNASSTTKNAAGAHKDRKKAEKQGDIKHKNKDYFEHLETLFAEKLDESITDQDKKDVDAIKAAIKRLQNELNDPNPNVDKENIKQRIATEKKRLGLYGQSVDEHIVKVKGGYELKSKKTGKNLGKYPTRAGAEKRERQVQYFKHANEEVDMEGDTIKNSLHTIVRVASHLEKAVTDNEQFPEWVSEKIGSIKSMMVNVMDYVISSHERNYGDHLDHGPIDEAVEISNAHKSAHNLSRHLNASGLKVDYNQDGSATIIAKQKYGFKGEANYYGPGPIPSYALADAILRYMGGKYNLSEKELNNYTAKIGDLIVHITKTSPITHEIHISNIENEVDESPSKALMVKHIERNYGDKIKADAITGNKEKAEKANNKLSFLRKVKNNLDAEKFAEGWTHDSLADQLFEHERTYLESLSNKLNKEIKKYQ